MIVGAYLTRLRHVVSDKRELVARALALLGDAAGPEADALRGRLNELGRKYALFSQVFDRLLPGLEGPIDLERLLAKLPTALLGTIGELARAAIDLGHRFSSRRSSATRPPEE